MLIFKTIILGIVQGLTEFLPVSSSGHLVIFEKLFGIKTGQLTLDVFLHFGTLIPILIIFWNDIKDIITFKKESRRLSCLIIIAIIPTGLMGYFLEDLFTKLFSSVIIVGFMLLFTGSILYLAEKLATGDKDLTALKEHNALLIGIAQGVAIMPGISRSGTTIVASLFQGLDRESAARFSFLISIPVILGAGVLKLKDAVSVGLNGLSWGMILAGTLAAAISGYFAIKYLLHVLKEGSLKVFSYYCFAVGVIVIILSSLF